MADRKIAKKSIKLAYLRAFFAHNFFSRAYFCVHFFKNISTDSFLVIAAIFGLVK